MPLDIKISPMDYKKWSPGSRLATRDADYRALLPAFCRLIADLYVKELVESINSQRYKSQWEPLTPSYLEFKESHGLSTNTWEATSLLKESITYYRSGNSWVVGVNRRLRYPKTNVLVYKVVRWMEYGTEKMPARPLFQPVKRRLEKNMSKYWKEFLKSRGFV